MFAYLSINVICCQILPIRKCCTCALRSYIKCHAFRISLNKLVISIISMPKGKSQSKAQAKGGSDSKETNAPKQSKGGTSVKACLYF